MRDVEKLDRQDNAAATCLFSASVLQYLCDNHPDYIGEIVYLFVFGELIDAYQNRSMPHAECIKLVLRAQYFLDAWEAFLTAGSYPKMTYTLSREALNITRIIIEGFLALVYIHRDFIDGLSPLLPWLHSSEPCEHMFGEARLIVKDFTMLDFVHMMPKLCIKMCQTVLKEKTSDPRARASGYMHTYFDAAGLDELSLSAFPSDEEIHIITGQAADEADSLVGLLGLSPSQVHGLHHTGPALSSISAWYSTPQISQDDNFETSSTISTEDEEVSEAQQLQDLLDAEEGLSVSRTMREEREVTKLACAAVALTADEMTKVYVNISYNYICIYNFP